MKHFLTRNIILSCFLIGLFSQVSLAQDNDPFIPKSMYLDEFPYPFRSQPIDIPDRVLNKIQNLDILFLGETHTASIFLEEKHSNQKIEFNSYRLNSLNQENIYFHFINRFSKIHKEAKKCLWLEYDSNDSRIEEYLKGLSFFVSHYFLINTAKEQGWKVFAVDNWELANIDIDNFDPALDLRDQFMSKQIAQTISNGDCEKSIFPVGMAHLSGHRAYLNKYDFECKAGEEYFCESRDEYLNELVKIELDNLNLDKRIGFFIMESWSEIQTLRTREDVLTAYETGKRDFKGWNLQSANLTEALLARVDLREAYLYETDLREADLQGAILRHAVLTGAKLNKANLFGADLRGADLRLADFRKAYYDNQTLFPDNFEPKKQGMVFISE